MRLPVRRDPAADNKFPGTEEHEQDNHVGKRIAEKQSMHRCVKNVFFASFSY